MHIANITTTITTHYVTVCEFHSLSNKISWFL